MQGRSINMLRIIIISIIDAHPDMISIHWIMPRGPQFRAFDYSMHRTIPRIHPEIPGGLDFFFSIFSSDFSAKSNFWNWSHVTGAIIRCAYVYLFIKMRYGCRDTDNWVLVRWAGIKAIYWKRREKQTESMLWNVFELKYRTNVYYGKYVYQYYGYE